jgi:hypothetical protein
VVCHHANLSESVRVIVNFIVVFEEGRMRFLKISMFLLLFVITTKVYSQGGQTTKPSPQSANQTQSTPPSDQRVKSPLAFGLEDGTPVKLRLSRTISSADAHVDDRVDFEVLEDIKLGEVLVVPKGGIAWGTVTEAQAKRRMARGGKLNINIDAVRLLSGEKVALRAVKEVKGGGHTGAMTGGIVAASIVFFPAAPFFLFMHGKDITIPKGTDITAYINGDMSLDPKKFEAKPASETPSTAAAPTPAIEPIENRPNAETSAVLIKSVPDGAEITVDGRFVGSTPSTLNLSPGDHTILITKSGFKGWQRTISVTSGGSVSVNANLEEIPKTDSSVPYFEGHISAISNW